MSFENLDHFERMEELQRIREEMESRNAVLNIEKVEQILEDYKSLRALGADAEVKVTGALHKPFRHTGYITMEAEDMILSQPECLADAISRCDTMEVYTLSNGKLRLTLNYTDLIEYVNS